MEDHGDPAYLLRLRRLLLLPRPPGSTPSAVPSRASTLRPASRPSARPKSASLATRLQPAPGCAVSTQQQWKPPALPGAAPGSWRRHCSPTALWYCPGGAAAAWAKQTLPLSVDTHKSAAEPPGHSEPWGPLTSLRST